MAPVMLNQSFKRSEKSIARSDISSRDQDIRTNADIRMTLGISRSREMCFWFRKILLVPSRGLNRNTSHLRYVQEVDTRSPTCHATFCNFCVCSLHVD